MQTLNPHLHSLLPDGLFVSDQDDAALTFAPLPAPTTEEIEELTLKVARRLTAVVERLCGDACETDARMEGTVGSLQDALAAAVRPPLSPSSKLGLPEEETPQPTKPLCARPRPTPGAMGGVAAPRPHPHNRMHPAPTIRRAGSISPIHFIHSKDGSLSWSVNGGAGTEIGSGTKTLMAPSAPFRGAGRVLRRQIPSS